MPSSINSNLMAQNTANNLNAHYSRLATSIERLSSGLRVNSAADDAAGLAIRELMRADVAAFHQGVRNANDAISMIQTADGALSVIDEKLIRMKELAEQAATGTYDSTQRLMIDSEFQAMGAEIDRIAKATEFNGIHLLDGSLKREHDGSRLESTGAMKIHFGSGNDSAEDYYYVDIDDCGTVGLGLRNIKPFPKATEATSWINEAQIDYAGRHIILDIGDRIAGRSDAAFMTGLDFYQLPVGLQNITITSKSSVTHPFHKPHVCLFTKDGDQLTGPPADGSNWSPVVTPPRHSQTVSGSPWWNGISENKLISDGIAKGVFSNDASYNAGNFLYRPGSSIVINNLQVKTDTGLTEIGSTWTSAGRNEAAIDDVILVNEITDDLVFFIGGHDNPGGGCNRYTLRVEADITDEFLLWLKGMEGDEIGTDMGMLRIQTQEKAQNALAKIDRAIERKDKVRAHLGAMQNRLENTVTNLSIQAENLQASESRISDVDVATEMTQFVRNQILTQSATAMLGQANSYPHMLMNLMNG